MSWSVWIVLVVRINSSHFLYIVTFLNLSLHTINPYKGYSGQSQSQVQYLGQSQLWVKVNVWLTRLVKLNQQLAESPNPQNTKTSILLAESCTHSSSSTSYKVRTFNNWLDEFILELVESFFMQEDTFSLGLFEFLMNSSSTPSCIWDLPWTRRVLFLNSSSSMISRSRFTSILLSTLQDSTSSIITEKGWGTIPQLIESHGRLAESPKFHVHTVGFSRV